MRNSKVHWLTMPHCLCLSTMLIMLVFPVSAGAQAINNGHCYAGCPIGVDSQNHLIIRPAYTLSYNLEKKSADWVAYTVTAESVGIASSLSREVKADNLGFDSLTLDDFEGQTEFEMARYVPLVDFAGTPFWDDLNYSTNFVPRATSLHRGAWYGLSWAIRNAVNRLGELYVVTGPIYEQEPDPSRHAEASFQQAPKAFFKVIIDQNGRQSAFVLEQATAVHVHHCELESEIAKIQELTGLTILPDLQAGFGDSITANLGCF